MDEFTEKAIGTFKNWIADFIDWTRYEEVGPTSPIDGEP